jgi:hypothetical protein
MANKIYIREETAKVWTDTGGDYALDIGGLTATTGVRAGTEGDLGASPRSGRYRWTLVVDGFDTAPVVGESVDLYLAMSHDATQATRDGDLSGSDGASSTVVLPNLLFLGSAIVQTTTAGDELVTSGVVTLAHRYVTPVVHNNTADNLLSTSDAHKFILTPIPDEVQ